MNVWDSGDIFVMDIGLLMALMAAMLWPHRRLYIR